MKVVAVFALLLLASAVNARICGPGANQRCNGRSRPDCCATAADVSRNKGTWRGDCEASCPKGQTAQPDWGYTDTPQTTQALQPTQAPPVATQARGASGAVVAASYNDIKSNPKQLWGWEAELKITKVELPTTWREDTANGKHLICVGSDFTLRFDEADEDYCLEVASKPYEWDTLKSKTQALAEKIKACRSVISTGGKKTLCIMDIFFNDGCDFKNTGASASDWRAKAGASTMASGGSIVPPNIQVTTTYTMSEMPACIKQGNNRGGVAFTDWTSFRTKAEESYDNEKATKQRDPEHDRYKGGTVLFKNAFIQANDDNCPGPATIPNTKQKSFFSFKAPIFCRGSSFAMLTELRGGSCTHKEGDVRAWFD